MSRDYTNSEGGSQYSGSTGSTGSTMDTVKDLASEAKEKASQYANSASESASRGLNSAASAVKDAAGKFGGQASDAAKKVAKGLESTSTYIQHHDISEMGDDLMNVCRKYPAQALITSLALGFLVGRGLRR